MKSSNDAKKQKANGKSKRIDKEKKSNGMVKKEQDRKQFSKRVMSHVDVIEIEIEKIKADLKMITEHNLLDAILFPLTKEEFLRDYYNKKALVIKSKSSRANQTRFKHLTD